MSMLSALDDRAYTDRDTGILPLQFISIARYFEAAIGHYDDGRCKLSLTA